MASIIIDGQTHEAAEGKNLLEATLSLGLDLPYFCWHPAMGSIGACRQCAVVQFKDEEAAREGKGKLVMACMTPVADGAIFSLNGDEARGFRRNVVESLMINHPHDCPVCAEGGECHLQDMTVMAGHRDRRFRGRKRTHRNQYLGPLVHHEMNRCITCYRCTRFYNDYAGGRDLAALAIRDNVYFGRHEEGVLESEFAGNLVEVCPTGVFTDKPLAHDYTRKWDLQSAPSVCMACSVGCNTLPGERYGELKRVHNRFNAAVNGYFLCDRGRYGGGYVNSERGLRYPGLRGADGKYEALDHHRALQHMLHVCAGGSVAGIGSPRASVEANYLLRLLVGEENYSPGFGIDEDQLVREVARLLQGTPATIPDLRAIESADAVLVLGEDPTQTAPRIALALRQSVRNRAFDIGAELGLQRWQDAAVRNLAQDRRSPLYIATVADSRLDDVAAASLSLAPPDIARLGEAVAARLAGGDADAPEPIDRGLFDAIVDALSTAKRPLILSGTGSGSAEVPRAAARVARALSDRGSAAMLSLTVPEANSLGQALLAGEEAPGLDDVARGGARTLIVLENDLYRRGPAVAIDRLLDAFEHVVVLDGLDNATTSRSELALPAASALESEGTVVNLEGRAQRFYPVLRPAGERRPAWFWLLATMVEQERPEVRDLHCFDDIVRACARSVPLLAGMQDAAPTRDYRNRGQRIPRQPPRYSGRTAMHAHESVHEPRPVQDEETPLAWSMEGMLPGTPAALLPFVWAPGWNSNQALHRFQAEVGGALHDGPAGVRLLAPAAGKTSIAAAQSAPFAAQPDRWLLVPRPRVFGSDELSAMSPPIAALTVTCLELSPADAESLGVADGDGLTVDGETTLEVRINPRMVAGCAGYSAGCPGTAGLRPLSTVSLRRADNWRRPRARIIGSDGGGRV
ncbi:MAG: NADH-quinone oxidoreductase subunit NuoG [Halioglobus sp.]|nr:NADH-quinone oxidoreductase subunit NuoG [Halioglobus sp.]